MQLIESPAAVALLELLRRSPDTYWSASAAAAAAGMTPEAAAAALELLEEHALVERARQSNAFRYAALDS